VWGLGVIVGEDTNKGMGKRYTISSIPISEMLKPEKRIHKKGRFIF